MYHFAMASIRTTVMADEVLVARLRQIADAEGISLAEVIRQGLEWRADRTRPRLSFTGAGESRSALAPIGWSAPLEVTSTRGSEPDAAEIARLRALASRRARELSDRAAG
jgi:hypothetical protein